MKENLPGSKNDIPRRVSYKKKIANDYQRQKDIMDTYIQWYGDSMADDVDKMNVNYDLLNGRLDMKLYEKPICVEIEGEKVTLDDIEIVHYPLIYQIGSTIKGEEIQRPFKPIARETGEYGQSLRSKKFNELLRELINFQIVVPIRDEVTAAFINQAGVNQNFNLSPEELQQIQQEIERRTAEKTPEQVIDFMANDYSTPTQRGAQQLVNHFVKHLDLKTLQSSGFQNCLPTGIEAYIIGDRHNEPTITLANPKYLRWGGSQNTEWIQDGEWATYDEWLTLTEAQQEFAEYLAELSDEELKSFIEPIGGFKKVGDPRYDNVQNAMMIDLSTEGSALAEKYKAVNYKTKQGQKDIVNLYQDVIAKYGKHYGNSPAFYGVRKTTVWWRDKAKFYFVTRLVDGDEKTMWFAENYESIDDDIKVIEVWIDEIWEGTKLGHNSSEALYINIRPVPNQWPSIYNPFGTKLPVVGKKYNSPMNNTKNISWVDPGKPWQMEFDTTMAQIKHEMKTDFGKMFMFLMDFKPDGWTWQKWLNTAKNTKLLFAQIKKHGGQVDPNWLRSVDVSKASAIAEKLSYAQYCRQELVMTLNFNTARLGDIGQYSTNQNVQQSQAASYNQTEALFETHRLIVEKALNAFMNRAKSIYRNHNKRFFIFDDVTRTEMEVSPDFWYEEWAIEFSTSSDDIKKVQELKMLMQAFIQNNMSFEGVLALALADNTADIIDIMKKENKRIEQIRQEQIQLQQQQFQAQLQSQQQIKAEDRQLMAQLEVLKLQSQERRAAEQSLQFQKQADADADGQSDILEKSEMELTIQKLIEDKKAALKELEILTNKELKEKELSIKAKDSENKVKIAASRPKPSTSARK